MRPGPATEVLGRGVAIGGRVDAWRAGHVLARDIPVADLVLEATADRVVPSQVSFTAPLDFVPVDAMSPLANVGQRVHVWSVLSVDGEPVEIELGWFLITDWEETESAVRVTALDLMQTVEENPAAWPSSPPKGATLRSEAQRLAQMPVILDGIDDHAIPRNVEWGYSRTEALRDLAEAHGCGYGVKPDGYLHLWPRLGGDPVAHYTGRDLLVEAPRKARPRRPNRFMVVGNGQRPAGTERDDIAVQDFATSKNRDGWEARQVSVKLTHPAVENGKCLRATWDKDTGASMTNPGLTLVKFVPKAGVKTVQMWVRASTTADIRVEAWDGNSKAAETVTPGGMAWAKAELTVPNNRKFTRVRVYQVGGVADNHWIEVDEVHIGREWTVKKVRKTETLYAESFTKGTHEGWSGSQAAVSWTYPPGGQYREFLKAGWGGLQGDSTGHMILTWTPKEPVPLEGAKTLDFWVKSNTAHTIHFKVWAREVLAASRDVSATDWTHIVLTVPDQLTLTAMTVEQDGVHWSDHYIGFDQVNIWRAAPKMVDAQFTALAQAIDAPYDPTSYGWVTQRTELSSAVTQKQVTDAAGEALRSRLISREVRPLEIVPDPRIELGDVISVDTGEEMLVGHVVAYSLPVSEPGAMMRVDVEVHEW